MVAKFDHSGESCGVMTNSHTVGTAGLPHTCPELTGGPQEVPLKLVATELKGEPGARKLGPSALAVMGETPRDETNPRTSAIGSPAASDFPTRPAIETPASVNLSQSWQSGRDLVNELRRKVKA